MDQWDNAQCTTCRPARKIIFYYSNKKDRETPPSNGGVDVRPAARTGSVWIGKMSTDVAQLPEYPEILRSTITGTYSATRIRAPVRVRPYDDAN